MLHVQELTVFVVHLIRGGSVERTDQILHRNEVAGYLESFNRCIDGELATVVPFKLTRFDRHSDR